MGEYLNNAVNIAGGIIMAVFTIVLLAWFFHDWIFGMLADMHRSWKRHFSNASKQDS